MPASTYKAALRIVLGMALLLGAAVAAPLPVNNEFTLSPTGCQCYFDASSNDCACCAEGGCGCPAEHKSTCVECGKPWEEVLPLCASASVKISSPPNTPPTPPPQPACNPAWGTTRNGCFCAAAPFSFGGGSQFGCKFHPDTCTCPGAYPDGQFDYSQYWYSGETEQPCYTTQTASGCKSWGCDESASKSYPCPVSPPSTPPPPPTPPNPPVLTDPPPPPAGIHQHLVVEQTLDQIRTSAAQQKHIVDLHLANRVDVSKALEMWNAAEHYRGVKSGACANRSVDGDLGGAWMSRASPAVTGLPHHNASGLLIFGVHDQGQTKMVGFMAAPFARVDGRAHSTVQPIDAASIGRTWDSAPITGVPDQLLNATRLRPTSTLKAFVGACNRSRVVTVSGRDVADRMWQELQTASDEEAARVLHRTRHLLGRSDVSSELEAYAEGQITQARNRTRGLVKLHTVMLHGGIVDARTPWTSETTAHRAADLVSKMDCKGQSACVTHVYDHKTGHMLRITKVFFPAMHDSARALDGGGMETASNHRKLFFTCIAAIIAAVSAAAEAAAAAAAAAAAGAAAAAAEGTAALGLSVASEAISSAAVSTVGEAVASGVVEAGTEGLAEGIGEGVADGLADTAADGVADAEVDEVADSASDELGDDWDEIEESEEGCERRRLRGGRQWGRRLQPGGTPCTPDPSTDIDDTGGDTGGTGNGGLNGNGDLFGGDAWGGGHLYLQ